MTRPGEMGSPLAKPSQTEGLRRYVEARPFLSPWALQKRCSVQNPDVPEMRRDETELQGGP